jgi:hypothetical protein
MLNNSYPTAKLHHQLHTMSENQLLRVAEELEEIQKLIPRVLAYTSDPKSGSQPAAKPGDCDDGDNLSSSSPDPLSMPPPQQFVQTLAAQPDPSMRLELVVLAFQVAFVRKIVYLWLPHLPPNTSNLAPTSVFLTRNVKPRLNYQLRPALLEYRNRLTELHRSMEVR